MNAEVAVPRFPGIRKAAVSARQDRGRAGPRGGPAVQDAPEAAAAAALVSALVRGDSSPAESSRRTPRRADLAAGLREGLTAAVVAAHAAGGWALMQRMSAPPDAIPEVALLQVEWVAPAARTEPPAASPAVRRSPSPRKPPAAPALVAAAPAALATPAFAVPLPAPATPHTAPAQPIAPVEVAVAAAAAAAPPSPAPTQAAAPAPARPPATEAAPLPTPTIASSAVRYLDPPAPVYPGTSRRLAEAGRVVVRVLIDERGLPAQLLLQTSSGYRRLDDAALAALRAARFVAYSDGGVTQRVWALVPIDFQLES